MSGGTVNASHEQRLAWMKESIDFFSKIDESHHSKPVPACPGWTIANLISHFAYGAGVGWPAMMTATPETLMEAFETAIGSVPENSGVELFDETMATLMTTITSHDPSDPCNTLVGPGSYSFWAWHGSSEFALHQIDAENVLGLPIL